MKPTNPRAKTKASDSPGEKKAKAKSATKVIGKVMTALKAEHHDEADLFSELEKLAIFIENAKKEISTIQLDEVREYYLPRATYELDAIVEATARATHAIMDTAEYIEDIVDGMEGESADKLSAATTAIYEACTFQDITGQRISKVINTMNSIEKKINHLITAFDHSGNKLKLKKVKAKNKPVGMELTDEEILDGPQSAEKAKTQAEIDALLASFD